MLIIIQKGSPHIEDSLEVGVENCRIFASSMFYNTGKEFRGL